MDLLFFGVLVAGLVQVIKKRFGTGEYATLGVVAAVSLVIAAGYVAIKDTVYLQTLLQIVAYAGAVYTYIIERFQK